MLFNSPEFLLCFLPVLMLEYALASRFGRSGAISVLSLASIAFYAYWSPVFLLLLLASICANYGCSRLIWRFRASERIQRAILVVGITANLAALGFFKYLFPLWRFCASLLHIHYGLQFSIHHIHYDIQGVPLPLGISFFTFTQIGYLVDLSQDEAKPQDLPSYVLFVTFFPHLIAGPIVHHRELMPQFASGRDFSMKGKDLSLGVSWFVLGLAKKVLIADRLAPYANFTFLHATQLAATQAWVGVLTYALQLYFDFSGYSDMAMGLARMFSIELPINFDSPYKAASIIEYWSRWHMTLTRYLTLYLYNPISIWVNRKRLAAGKPTSKKAIRTLAGFLELLALPTITTMLLAGVWHGAGIQFLIFGTLHGAYLVINHAWRLFRPKSVISRLIDWTPGSVLITFLSVLVADIFFRATSTSDAVSILRAMLGLHGLSPWHEDVLSYALPLFVLLPVVWLLPNTQEILGQAKSVRAGILDLLRVRLRWKADLVWATSLGIIMVGVLCFMVDTTQFLYFQF